MRTTLKFMSVVVKAVPNGYGLSGFMLYSWPLCSCRPGNVYSPPPLPVDVFRQRVVLIVQNPNTEAFDSRSVRSRNAKRISAEHLSLDGVAPLEVSVSTTHLVISIPTSPPIQAEKELKFPKRRSLAKYLNSLLDLWNRNILDVGARTACCVINYGAILESAYQPMRISAVG